MADTIPMLLGFAVLLPLLSFVAILIAGPRMGKAGGAAAWVATLAIVGACVLSFISLFGWLGAHPISAAAHHAGAEHGGAQHEGTHGDDSHGEGAHGEESHDESDQHGGAPHGEASGGGDHAAAAGLQDSPFADGAPDHPHTDDLFYVALADGPGADAASGHAEGAHGHDSHGAAKPYMAAQWWTLGQFGKLKLTIGYYIDALTVAMFCMVTLIASCIHFYAMGYMHDELHDFTDPEVTTADGKQLTRPGRYHRFFQALSLFCFSMLGLVIAGNVAMTFVFWELVGICSYFLIGFYVERHSASTAANKAFIVNRVGDFGMIIGLMALWAGLGTFAYGDVDGELGMFSLVRPATSGHAMEVPERMAVLAGGGEADGGHPGYWMLIVGGLGIFCGCVGKSAQFPLHVWLPDAMEGPTPVSALVHSATMVAAGVFLVARFYPMFTPEVLLVIAIIGAITLFMAATIAITATDIKRVLAYSTVSQLGYMMTALGVGAWLAGVLHLFTHAFFKSLLFMCSGSVIHAVHTNEMTEMGGLRKKMPWTAYTMLIGCLAIAGAGIPFVIGLSGYYSKDAILEQALLFGQRNPGLGKVFFFVAAGGAAITAFYMFRLWYMTFAGEPRDQERYSHAHESPPVMYRPLILLSFFAVAVAWPKPYLAIVGGLLTALIFLAARVFGGVGAEGEQTDDHGGDQHAAGHGHDEHGHAGHGHEGHGKPAFSAWLVPYIWCACAIVGGMVWQFGGWEGVHLSSLLEQARPEGTLEVGRGVYTNMFWPDEHKSHAPAIKTPATIIAFSTAVLGVLLATVFYCWKRLNPDDVRSQFKPIYNFLVNKWWFDELYDKVFVRPTHVVARLISNFDQGVIDRLINGLADAVRRLSNVWEYVADRTLVDGTVNKVASWTHSLGVRSRRVQTGRLRQYIMFIAVGMVAVFVVASFFWGYAFAG